MNEKKVRPPTQTTVSRGVKRIVGVFAAALIAYLCVFLWMERNAAADEATVPVVEQAAEEPAEEPLPEATEPGVTDRAKKAFGFLFHGDATEIVAEVNDELEQRLAAVAEQEAALAQREIDLREAEIAVAEEKDEARAYSDAIKAKHEALTACILQAIGGEK